MIDSFAAQVKDALARKGMRAWHLAQKAGVTASYIHGILSGKISAPRWPIVKKIAIALRLKYRPLLILAELDRIDPKVRAEIKEGYLYPIRKANTIYDIDA